MEATIESYVITEAQKNSRPWDPEPYLSAAPLMVSEGAASGEYIISVVLGDPAYDEMRTWLEANAERAVVNTNTLYPEWSAGISVDIGDLYTYAGTIYSCIQAHVTQSDWTPPVVPALWLAETPEGTIGDWTQPAGGHDAYQKYDQVIYNESVYESTYDANVHAPGVVNGGWVEV